MKDIFGGISITFKDAEGDRVIPVADIQSIQLGESSGATISMLDGTSFEIAGKTADVTGTVYKSLFDGVIQKVRDQGDLFGDVVRELNSIEDCIRDDRADYWRDAYEKYDRIEVEGLRERIALATDALSKERRRPKKRPLQQELDALTKQFDMVAPITNFGKGYHFGGDMKAYVAAQLVQDWFLEHVRSSGSPSAKSEHHYVPFGL